MSLTQRKLENLAAVKNALADKYENLAAITTSKPKEDKFKRKALRFRRVAKLLASKQKSLAR